MAPPVDAIETKDWKDIQAIHEAQLSDQIDYLATESDYYRRRFDEWGINPNDIRSFESFEAIPFTTKADERDAQANPPSDRPLGEHQAVATTELNRSISSSGTTGKPTYFGLTKRDRERWNQVIARCFHTAGIRPEDTVLFGVGQTMVPGGTPYFEAMTELGANVIPAGGGSTDRLLAAIIDLSPDVLFTTTSHLRYLGEEGSTGIEQDVSSLGIQKLVGGGEPGIATPEIRQELYDTWAVSSVREIMGLGDVIACLWAECEEENGMHYHGQGHAHVELIDPETGSVNPMATGAEGELVYTPLGREATPLLRFRSGDYIRVIDRDCSCGRTSPTIQCIGRSDDMLIYKGMNVFPTAIRDVLTNVEGVTSRMQVVVPKAGKMHFEEPILVEIGVEPKRVGKEHELAEEVISEVRTKLKVRIRPQFVPYSEIEPAEYKTDLVTVRSDE